MDFKELTKQFFSNFRTNLVPMFFAALFLLRSGRLLFNESMLDYAIILFAGIFMLAIVVVNQAKDHWKLPLWQNMLTFLNGMLGNFIFSSEPFMLLSIKVPPRKERICFYHIW